MRAGHTAASFPVIVRGEPKKHWNSSKLYIFKQHCHSKAKLSWRYKYPRRSSYLCKKICETDLCSFWTVFANLKKKKNTKPLCFTVNTNVWRPSIVSPRSSEWQLKSGDGHAKIYQWCDITLTSERLEWCDSLEWYHSAIGWLSLRYSCGYTPNFITAHSSKIKNTTPCM